MSRAPIHQQPKVSADLNLLKQSHVVGELHIDLYGSHDDAGYDVNDIAAAGTNVSLSDLVAPTFFETLTQWCNDNLPTSAELRNESLKRAQFERRLRLHEYA